VSVLTEAHIEITGRVLVTGGPPAKRRYGTSLRRLANGDLLVGFHESAGGALLNDGAMVIVRSRDNGQTWSQPVPLYAVPGFDCGPAGGLKVLPDGTVLLVTTRIQRNFNPDTTYGLDMFNTATAITRSTDHGYTWGELEPIEGFWPFFHEMYGTADPLDLGDGRLLFCMQGTRESGGRGWESSVVTTTDDGRTFSRPVIIATSPEIDFNDAALARLPDGRILAMIRSEQAPFHAYRSYSADNGATWTAPEQSGILGSTLCLQLLRSGAIVCFYRDRVPERPGVSFAISADAGLSWRFAGRIYEAPNWFCGYPSVTHISDDIYLCVYFGAIVDGNSSIEGVFFRDIS
jgi:hypothetical protein